jgi:hypothetical protein
MLHQCALTAPTTRAYGRSSLRLQRTGEIGASRLEHGRTCTIPHAGGKGQPQLPVVVPPCVNGCAIMTIIAVRIKY